MRTLGHELISSEVVALIELIKNAYDADATHVLIRFTAPLETGSGCIEVIDNGHGMSMDTIEQAWMEPATRSKRTRKYSESGKRRLLGEKGVGRFAASRLTNELELFTKRATDTLEIFALFDWTQFDNEDLYLDQIEILTEKAVPREIGPQGTLASLWDPELWQDTTQPTKAGLNHGTILRMNGLNKSWDSNDFAELQRGLSRLVSPFSEHADFRITLALPDEYGEFSREISPPEIIKHPHYLAKGSVSSDGVYQFILKAYAAGLDKEIEGRFLWGDKNDKSSGLFSFSEESASALLDSLGSDEEKIERQIQTGPLEIELRIWDRDDLGNVMEMAGETLRNVRRDLDAVAGINIYRDDFRVLPYGEPKDDWLRLDIRRVQKPTVHLSNNQIVGYVSISADANPNLRDQSNREGLDENQALEDLRQILLSLLNHIELIRRSLRPKREHKPISAPVAGLFSAINLESIRDRIIAVYPDDKDTLQLISETQKLMEEQVDEIQIVMARYHNLATLGSLVDVVLHDGQHPLSAMIKQAIMGQEDVEALKPKSADCDTAQLQNIRKRFEDIEIHGTTLRTVFRGIEPFAGRRRGRPAQLYLENVIKDAVGIFQGEITKLGVTTHLPTTQTLVRVDQAEIQRVIIILMDNSLYWLQAVDRKRRAIHITVKRVAESHVEILFRDTGPGIQNIEPSLIFQPYVSTKPNGVGLGLAIAGEIVSDYYDGKLELLESGSETGAVFRITLKRRV